MKHHAFFVFNSLLSCRILLPNRPLISFRVRTLVQLLALIAGCVAATQTGATEENETVVASPDGTYELHQIVPDNDSDVDLTNARSAELEVQLKESETQ